MNLMDRVAVGIANMFERGFAIKERSTFTSGSNVFRATAREATYNHPDYGVITNQERAMAAVSWVYIAVSRISKGLAKIDFQVEKPVPDKGTWEPVLESPLLDLLHKPNQDQTRFELFESTAGYLLTTGNAFWYLSGERGVKEPSRVQCLRPDRMRIVPDESGRKGLVGGYVYETSDVKIPLDPVEIIHFKLFNPMNDYWGLSPVEVASLAAEADNAQARWNAKFFGKDAAVPAGIVVLKGYVGKADFDRIKEEWTSSYGGPQRKTAFVRATDLDWKDIGLSQKDMDFLGSRAFNKQEIFDIYDLPAGATDPNSTEANSVTGLNYFKEFTIWPLAQRVAERITAELIPFWDPTQRFRFSDIRPIDRQLDLTEAEAKRAVRTWDEARALEGLEPIPFPKLDGLPDGLEFGSLPYSLVNRITLSDLTGVGNLPPGEDQGTEGKGSEAGGDERKRPSRARAVEGNQNDGSEKPKRRQGMAAKPEKATKDLEDPEGLLVRAIALAEELKTYQTWCENRIKRGNPIFDERPFKSTLIPADLRSALDLRLQTIQSVADLRLLFAQAPYLLQEEIME